MRFSRTRVAALGIAGLLVVGVGATALSQDGGAWPELVGTWSGTARIAAAGGTVEEFTETIVIDRQQDELLWGKDTWTTASGEPQESLVLGTLLSDRSTVLLTEEHAIWSGTVDGDAIHVVLTFANGGDDHGAVELTLTRQ
jgi:hypothetical protein